MQQGTGGIKSDFIRGVLSGTIEETYWFLSNEYKMTGGKSEKYIADRNRCSRHGNGNFSSHGHVGRLTVGIYLKNNLFVCFCF